jgi:hypothetical protein
MVYSDEMSSSNLHSKEIIEFGLKREISIYGIEFSIGS